MNKEVKNQGGEKQRLVKKDFELVVLDLMKKGLRPVQIAERYGMDLPNLSYYLSSLKKQLLIKKVAGVWEILPAMQVQNSSHKGKLQVGGLVKEDKRGHAFIWKVKPKKRMDWKAILERANVHWTPKGLAGTPRIEILGRKIWLAQEFVTIWEEEDKDFFAANAIESKVKAVRAFIEVLEAMKKALGVEFEYTFTLRRQHYGHVENLLAKKFNHEGKSFMIKNEKGYWLSFDFSQQVPEMEFIGTPGENDAVVQSLTADSWWNSHEKQGFKVDANFTLEALNKVTANQTMFAQNIETHMKVLRDIGSAVTELKDEVKKLREGNK